MGERRGGERRGEETRGEERSGEERRGKQSRRKIVSCFEIRHKQDIAEQRQRRRGRAKGKVADALSIPRPLSVSQLTLELIRLPCNGTRSRREH